MFTKHFVRFNTREQLQDSDVIEYFDIVQSVIPTKLVTGISSDGDKVSIDVMIYNDMDDEGELFIHEIVLEDDIDSAEGDEISEELSDLFPETQFTFEASIEVWYKTNIVGSNTPFENASYTQMTIDAGIPTSSNAQDQFYDASYSIDDLVAFDAIQVKILGADSAVVRFRVIALIADIGDPTAMVQTAAVQTGV